MRNLVPLTHSMYISLLHENLQIASFAKGSNNSQTMFPTNIFVVENYAAVKLGDRQT